MKKILFLFLFTFLFLSNFSVSFARKSPSLHAQLVGSWNVLNLTKRGRTYHLPPSKKLVMIFKKDGTLLFQLHKKGKKKAKIRFRGTWSWKGKVLITKDKKTNTTEVSTISFHKNHLILSYKKSTMTLQRLSK